MIIIAQRQGPPIALALHPRNGTYDYNWAAEVDLWQLCRWLGASNGRISFRKPSELPPEGYSWRKISSCVRPRHGKGVSLIVLLPHESLFSPTSGNNGTSVMLWPDTGPISSVRSSYAHLHTVSPRLWYCLKRHAVSRRSKPHGQ